MGFGINATVVSGTLIGGAFAVGPEVGAAAAGSVGALYACAMTTYGVFGMIGLATRSLSSDEEEKQQQSTSKQFASSMQNIAQKTDSDMQQFQQLARVRGSLKAHDD